MDNSLIDSIKRPVAYMNNFFNSLNFQVKLIFSLILSISIFITLCAFVIIQDIQSNIDNQVSKLNHNLRATQTLAQLEAQVLIKQELHATPPRSWLSVRDPRRKRGRRECLPR